MVVFHCMPDVTAMESVNTKQHKDLILGASPWKSGMILLMAKIWRSPVEVGS